MKLTFLGLALSVFALIISLDLWACGSGCGQRIRRCGGQVIADGRFQDFQLGCGGFNGDLQSLIFTERFADDSEFLLDSTRQFAVNFRTGTLHPVEQNGRVILSSTFLNTGLSQFDPRTLRFFGAAAQNAFAFQGIPGAQPQAFTSPFQQTGATASLAINANNQWVQRFGDKDWPLLIARDQSLTVRDPRTGQLFRATPGDILFEAPPSSGRLFFADTNTAQQLAQEYSKWWFPGDNVAAQQRWASLSEADKALAKGIVQRYYPAAVQQRQAAGSGYAWANHGGAGAGAVSREAAGRTEGYATKKTLWDKSKDFFKASSPNISLDKLAKKANKDFIDVKCATKGEEEPVDRKLVLKHQPAKGKKSEKASSEEFKLGLISADEGFIEGFKEKKAADQAKFLGKLIEDDGAGYVGTRETSDPYYPIEELKIRAVEGGKGQYTFLLLKKPSESAEEDIPAQYCWTGSMPTEEKEESLKKSGETTPDRAQVLASSAKIVASCIKCHTGKEGAPQGQVAGFQSDGTQFTQSPQDKVAGIDRLIAAVEGGMPPRATPELRAQIVQVFRAWRDVASQGQTVAQTTSRETASSGGGY